ncbi:DUF397 domain-containing protein [Actinomadura violacea]|uniref:DUF397 domain-containing protein n=1 Tax=Actinomadura violacea TaxID=2819934 RepID=A0ABS3S7U6_9ACTN|nr:DUF397 domain-containing protein [Actinomadura violacea]MBO2465073.1 DUF397 domain-containing protein [Actinomadura violacea]
MTAPTWRKSSRSTQGTSGECVEVALLDDSIGVRDSKLPTGTPLKLTPAQFAAVLQHLKDVR